MDESHFLLPSFAVCSTRLLHQWSSLSGCWPAHVWTGGNGDLRGSTQGPQEQKFHRKGNNTLRKAILQRAEIYETDRTFLPRLDKQAHWGSPGYTPPSRCAYDLWGKSCWDGPFVLTHGKKFSVISCSGHKVDEFLVGELRPAGPVRWLS